MMEKPRVMKLELEPSLNSYTSFPQPEKTGLSSKEELSSSAEEDTEISIFDAQRYFNETNNDARVCKRVSPLNLGRVSSDGCDLSALSRFSSASSATDGFGYGGGARGYRVRSFHATPTASSEASWNSQTGLLSNPPGAIAVTMKNPNHDHKKKGSSSSSSASKGGNSKIKWLWRRRCPCSGKKSVQVEPKTPASLNRKSLSATPTREEILLACNNNNPHQFHPTLLAAPRVVATATARPPLMLNDPSAAAASFTFPVLNQPKVLAINRNIINNNNSNISYVEVDDVDQARDSLEVFRPASEKKLASRISTVTDDDVASDTSSDLFEIESFSTATQGQTTPFPMYLRRDSLDEAAASASASSSFNARRSAAAANGCPYTAAMMMATAECYEPSEASIDWSVTTAEGFERGSVGVSEMEEAAASMAAAHGNGNGNGKKKAAGAGAGGLLSCRCEKAVSVGPNPVKCMPPQPPATSTSRHVGYGNKPPLPRLSLPFPA